MTKNCHNHVPWRILFILTGFLLTYMTMRSSININCLQSSKKDNAGRVPPSVQTGHSANHSARVQSSIRGNRRLHWTSLKRMYTFKYNLKGRIFTGQYGYVDTTALISTSIVHTFPQDLVKSKFDKNFFQAVRLMSPGMTILPDGNIFLALRVNVSPSPKLHQSRILKNYLYIQTLDSKYEPVSEGRLVNIPSPIVMDAGIQYGGPADPRAFTVQNKTMVLYNRVEGASAVCRDNKMIVIRQYIYSVKKDNSVPITIRDMPTPCWEKNWSLLSFSNRLSFIYSLDPLLITECSHTGLCQFKPGNGERNFSNAANRIHHAGLPGIRGGTPFEEYQWPYAISVGHTTSVCNSPYKVYDLYYAHLVVYNIEKQKVVYVSTPIKVHPNFMSRSRPPSPVIALSFIYPVSLIVRDSDTLHVGAHIDDVESFVFEITGVRELMTRIAEGDLNSPIAQGAVNNYVDDMQLCNIQRYS
ncbi:uncharacterized protein LOC106157657 [Lingula anatina]|uniref:Uncharacterized protein LOC106157657 n=1 Tax=Lingula anatina TaxID=7574 RepID=A0A1S3HTF0_LINAN|nr:uncharacterized protein LOC106157657 [Lingula anatina]|eukprot:XP_013388826.1 uncharacterized protein LOC106157657 [Lingula anatina]